MKLEEFKQIADQFYDYTQIPLILIQNESIVWPDVQVTREFYDVLFENLPLMKYPFKKELKHPLLSDGVYMLAHYNITLDEKVYRLLVGPSRISGQTERKRKENPLNFIRLELASNSERSFIKHVEFIENILKLSHRVEDFVYIDRNNDDKTNKKRYFNILSTRRLENFTRDSYQMELRILHYIKTQQINKIRWIVRSLENDHAVSLSSDEIQSLTYKFVSFVTIATRTAISDGIPIETAFSLSDSLIEELEFLSTQRELIDFFIYASEHFMRLYEKTSKVNVSPEIKQVFNYIDSHLFDKITLQDIADTISMSKTYLSTKFKKETGVGLNQYILERRIDEAKEMLLFTNYTFQDISTKLNFSSQSYFIKCFKNITRQTPQEYKNDHWHYNIWD